jgi:hypothetical protein
LISEELIVRAAAVIVKTDLGELTLVDYLKLLLTTMWEEGTEFNGKRPFGSSNWKGCVEYALIKNGIMVGEIDEENEWVDECDSKQSDAIVLAIIKRLVIKVSEYIPEPAHHRMGL